MSIDWNSPRMPSEESGLGSNESKWLGPPVRNTRTIDLARDRSGFALACPASKAESPGPRNAETRPEGTRGERSGTDGDGARSSTGPFRKKDGSPNRARTQPRLYRIWTKISSEFELDALS